MDKKVALKWGTGLVAGGFASLVLYACIDEIKDLRGRVNELGRENSDLRRHNRVTDIAVEKLQNKTGRLSEEFKILTPIADMVKENVDVNSIYAQVNDVIEQHVRDCHKEE